MADDFDEVHREGRIKWSAALRKVAGAKPPPQTVWINPDEIEDALQPLAGLGHIELPNGGGTDFDDVQAGWAKGTVELIHQGSAYVLRPDRVTLHWFSQAPGQSFIWIKNAGMAPSGLYKKPGTWEELVEIAPGDLRKREIWDAGYIGHTSEGNEIPLPSTARLYMPLLSGDVIITGFGSLWGLKTSYNGDHDKEGEQKVAAAIASAISTLGLTD